MKIIEKLEQGTPEWLEIRGRYLTGTDAYNFAIKKTPVDQILLDKTNNSFTGNYFTRRGHELEPVNRYIWEQVNGLEVRTPGFIRSDEFSIAGYSPDGVVYQDNKPIGLIECKSFNEARHLKNYEYAETTILLQMEWGMFVTGLPWCDLCLYNPDISDPEKQWLCKRYNATPIIQEKYASLCREYENNRKATIYWQENHIPCDY